VVVGCTPDVMLQAGFRQVDPDFPVFLHPETHEEYALARRETNIAAGYRGFALDISRTISLESDLARRDLTVNALAQAADGQLIDLFQGQRDLQARCLRHITSAFSDDPVRVLRVARFAAKLGHLGFTVAADTLELMREMVLAGSLSALQPQRIWLEMQKAFGYAQPWHFFTVLESCGAWSAGLITGKIDEQSKSLQVALPALRRACEMTDDPLVRFTAFWLQCPEPVALAAVIERRFARFLAHARLAWQHFLQLPGGSYEAVWAFLQHQQAWHPQGRYPAVMQVIQAQAIHLDLLDALEHARCAAASVQVESIRAQGLQGAAIGRALQAQRCAKIAAVWS
jgi:tRNA nucleotidyltransferase (CCA-adding enzyme)